MSARERGISDHLLLESFERLHKWLIRIGFSPREAEHGALRLTLVLTGEFSWAESREVVNGILGKLEERA